jgi:hypothetical protein
MSSLSMNSQSVSSRSRDPVRVSLQVQMRPDPWSATTWHTYVALVSLLARLHTVPRQTSPPPVRVEASRRTKLPVIIFFLELALCFLILLVLWVQQCRPPAFQLCQSSRRVPVPNINQITESLPPTDLLEPDSTGKGYNMISCDSNNMIMTTVFVLIDTSTFNPTITPHAQAGVSQLIHWILLLIPY